MSAEFLIYFLIKEGNPKLCVQKYFLKYDNAVRASRGMNCIVTNGSWLERHGVSLKILSKTKPKGAEYVTGVICNGIPLETC